MTSLVTSATPTSDARARSRSRPRRRARAANLRAEPTRVLAHYIAPTGLPREVVSVAGAHGCVLVVDRDRLTQSDARLIAHLAADEPLENALIASALFVRHATREHVRCRRVLAEDFSMIAGAESAAAELAAANLPAETEVSDRLGRTYRLEALAGTISIPELRWRRHPRHGSQPQPPQPPPQQPQPPPQPQPRACTVSAREAIGALQAYEPIVGLTRGALARHGARGDVSVATLRLELERVLRSPIVLNRELRQAVLARVSRQDLSMSEIAIRCGRIKRDAGGNVSGETSWLGRRIGLLPEGGRAAPTPWIHIDVLALIARRGLGVSPREVEPD